MAVMGKKAKDFLFREPAAGESRQESFADASPRSRRGETRWGVEATGGSPLWAGKGREICRTRVVPRNALSFRPGCRKMASGAFLFIEIC